MSYRDSTVRTIILPSGAKCSIRKFNGYDFVDAEFIPVVIPDPNAKGDGTATQSEDRKMMSAGMVMRRIGLLKCCGPLEVDGDLLTIVDKPFYKCAGREISIDQIENEDAKFIVTAVGEFSNMGKAAQAAATPFPAEQVAGGINSPNGEALRSVANGNSESPAV